MQTNQIKDLTPEQAETIMAAFARVTEMVVPAINAVVEAMQPIIEAYNALPDELKSEIAGRQVKEMFGEAATPAAVETKGGEYYHACDCDRKGVINVYHFSDCEGGTNCALLKYLEAEGVAEKHLKKNHEYTVTKDATGAFIFEGRVIPAEPRAKKVSDAK